MTCGVCLWFGSESGQMSPLFYFCPDKVGSVKVWVFSNTLLRGSVVCSAQLAVSQSAKSLMHPSKFMARVCGKRGWETSPKCFHRVKVVVNYRISGPCTRTSPPRNVGDFQSLKFVLNPTLEFATLSLRLLMMNNQFFMTFINYIWTRTGEVK